MRYAEENELYIEIINLEEDSIARTDNLMTTIHQIGK